jgi:hypothetical protein
VLHLPFSRSGVNQCGDGSKLTEASKKDGLWALCLSCCRYELVSSFPADAKCQFDVHNPKQRSVAYRFSPTDGGLDQLDASSPRHIPGCGEQWVSKQISGTSRTPMPLTHVACSCLRHQEIIFRFTKLTWLSSFQYIRADARTATSLGRLSSRSISATRQNGALSFSDRQEIVSGRGDLECGHRWRGIQCTYRHTKNRPTSAEVERTT